LTAGRLPESAALLAPTIPGASPAAMTPTAPVPPRPAPKAAAASPGPGPLRGIETAPAEPAAGKGDLKAMQQALNRWKQAYESRDVAAVSRVWPTISKTQLRSLDSAFDKMSQMTVLFRQCSLAGSVVRGSASCRVERSITFKTGRPETISSQVAFQLEKRAALWVIVGVRGA
jgi:hypothetical protein